MKTDTLTAITKHDQAPLLNDLARFITSTNKVLVYLRKTIPYCNIATGEIFLNYRERYNINKAILLHETAHLLYTKKFPESIRLKFNDYEQKQIKELTNALEDLRIENLIKNIIVLAPDFFKYLEIDTTRKIAERHSGTIEIDDQIKALFFLIKTAQPHLKDILKVKVEERIKDRTETALNYYSNNEQDLLNGTFENLINHVLNIYALLKDSPQEQEQQKQKQEQEQEQEQKDQEQKEQQQGDQEDSDQPNSENDQEQEQTAQAQDSKSKSKEQKGDQEQEQEQKEQEQQDQENEQDSEHENEQKKDQEKQGDQETAQEKQERKEREEQRKKKQEIKKFLNDIKKGTLETDDFNKEQEYKEKSISDKTPKARDLEKSDLIKETNALNILKRFCKPEIIDLNKTEQIDKFNKGLSRY